MKPLRTALIGCGKVGRIHASALRALPESELVAVCDNSPDRAAAFASEFGAAAFTDIDAMIRQARIEAVTIATPHPLHAAPTVRCAEGGVHVLVEKPMASSLADCDAMLAAGAQDRSRAGRDQPAPHVRGRPAHEGRDRRGQDWPADPERVSHV